MRLGLLTGGGDCPGLNAAIRAIVRYAQDSHGATVYGFRDGWRGVMEGTADELTRDDVRGILTRGGTILGTSGVQPFRLPDGVDRVRETLEVHRLDGFIVIGGEGTMGACAAMPEVPVVGVPKTIDNDIAGTDHSIGFRTAVQIAADLIDRLYSTAESHRRVMVCEVMGRSAGWIGLEAGIAGAADVILVPEHPFDIAAVARRVKQHMLEDRRFSIVVVSEGAKPSPGGAMEVPDYPLDENQWPRLGGIGALVAKELATRNGVESRITVLGHVQRGGSPVASDRVLATRLGVAAVDEAVRGGWGSIVGAAGLEIVTTPIGDAGREPRVVPEELWAIPQVLCE
jgi:ATP-dependent phosphofructokinase / diphosphate-dependent phosphofructokinase